LRLDGAYKRDRVSDLWLETNWGAGPGYRFWDNSISRFEITALFSQYYYRQHWADTIDAAWEVNGGELGWDWKQEVLASTLEFYSFGTIYKPQRSKVELIINDKVISDEIIDIDYGLETEWGVRYRLTQYVNASAKVILDYLKGVDISQQKRYYEFGIGFEW
jgi:hypothetical protein